VSVSPGEVYKCGVCGIVVAVLDAGAGEPICCGQPMTLQQPDRAGEEHCHRPIVTSNDDGVAIEVGSSPHPMQGEHFIQWVELTRRVGHVERIDLSPGEPPAVRFSPGPCQAVRIYCNRHGLWTN
jgi:superoxide reductase